MLEVCLLGRFEVKYGAEIIPITSRPSQSLFAFLILNAGTPYRREKLAGMLWPNSLETTARDNLRHALWRIRKFLPKKAELEYILADDLTITFNTALDYWLDVGKLENIKESVPVDDLMDILSLYQGELLPGFYDEWVELEREHLASLFEHHMARLMSLLQDQNRCLDILDWGERWIKLGQRPEPAYRALMYAHAKMGDMSKVASTYERCVDSLKELDIEPSEQTRVLYDRLKAGEKIIETGTTVRLNVTRKESPKTNLPTPITSFIGRKKEVDEVIHLVDKNRLVTLTGAGGVGKTRLAIQSSKSMLRKFDDGVWWVELAPLMNEKLVLHAVAGVLDVHESAALPLTESLQNFLGEKRLLLVLDNCEHLVRTCAQIAYDLLTRCANLKILSTSREALDVIGEFNYQVHPLSLPAPENRTIMDLLLDYEGIRLFVERANAKSGFALTENNAASVFNICQRLDGIPLAIELAAARTRTMTIENIADHLNDRFNLLTQGNRSAMPRHQTLRALIDWSYDLLLELEKVLWRRLSVFTGGWSLMSAEAICADDKLPRPQVQELLSHLVDKSLVLVEEQDGTPRYRMLDTIRQYGEENLQNSGESIEIHLRYLDFFIQLTDQAEPELMSGAQKKMLKQLDFEYGNLRSTINWSLKNDTEKALQLAVSLGRFYQIRGYLSEGKNTIEHTLQRATHTSKKMRARALLWIGALNQDYGDYSLSEESLQESVNLWRELGDQHGLAMSLNTLGHVAWLEGDHEKARRLLEESLGLYRQSEDQRGIGSVLHNLGVVVRAQGDLLVARRYLEECTAIARESGNKLDLISTLNDLGVVAEDQNEYATARHCYQEAISISDEFGAKDMKAYALNSYAHVLYMLGEVVESKHQYEESLIIFRETGDKRGIAFCLEGFAKIALLLGHAIQAARLIGASESVRREISAPLDSFEAAELDQDMTTLRSQLDDQTLKLACEQGRAMTLDQAIEFAFEYQ